jgi:sarcosine oxidase subunit gamma
MTMRSLAYRTSPLAQQHRAQHARFATVDAMAVPLAHADETPGRVDRLGIADVACLVRCGLKGPAAADWLAARGITVPAQPNAHVALPDGALIARLARTEFLLEDALGADTAARLRPAIVAGIDGVTPVPRQDCALVLTGARLNELFVQTCNVDLSSIDAASGRVVLTQMVGVSVTLLAQWLHGRPVWRLWADATFGPYLWDTLVGIARELEGGPIGLEALYPAAVLAAAVTPDHEGAR